MCNICVGSLATGTGGLQKVALWGGRKGEKSWT